jgi:ABC-type lipoprotein export system ATPase subunit
MVQKNFDYEFKGESKVYPFELPNLDFDFNILCIVGASGSGKSTLLKEFVGYKDSNSKTFNDNAIVSNFESPEIASERLSAVGLNSIRAIPYFPEPRPKIVYEGV